jgi:hypothetical protein
MKPKEHSCVGEGGDIVALILLNFVSFLHILNPPAVVIVLLFIGNLIT